MPQKWTKYDSQRPFEHNKKTKSIELPQIHVTFSKTGPNNLQTIKCSVMLWLRHWFCLPFPPMFSTFPSLSLGRLPCCASFKGSIRGNLCIRTSLLDTMPYLYASYRTNERKKYNIMKVAFRNEWRSFRTRTSTGPGSHRYILYTFLRAYILRAYNTLLFLPFFFLLLFWI